MLVHVVCKRNFCLDYRQPDPIFRLTEACFGNKMDLDQLPWFATFKTHRFILSQQGDLVKIHLVALFWLSWTNGHCWSATTTQAEHMMMTMESCGMGVNALEVELFSTRGAVLLFG